MGSITRTDVKNFQIYLGSKNLSTESINQITRIGVTALKWAFFNKFTQNNCFDGIFYCSVKHKTREILTFDEAQKLFKSEWKNKSSKLANLIAMCTGLRAGEIRALRICDFGEDRLYVRHSWSDFEHKLKSPKNSCERQVPLPKFLVKILKDYLFCDLSDDSDGFSCGSDDFSDDSSGREIFLAKSESSCETCSEKVESSCSNTADSCGKDATSCSDKSNSYSKEATSCSDAVASCVKEPISCSKKAEISSKNQQNQRNFLFPSKIKDSKNQQIPENPKKWRKDLKIQLKTLGIQKENVVFHSWRHFYSTVMAEQVELRKLSLVTGHKSLKVLEHYSEHVLNEDWREVQKISENLFSAKMKDCFAKRR